MTEQVLERLRQRMRSLGTVSLHVAEPAGACPVCTGPMGVQKTVHRHGRTLEHGTFEARETVHVCMAGCRWPSGSQVIRRAGALTGQLLPRSTVGYDVMALIGVERFVHFRQREEIQDQLRERHGLTLSTGEISRLGRLFLDYLERLHGARSGALRLALEADGGWPLHIDATGEDGRGTLLVALAGWRRWALGAWKIPTENAEAILPHLREVVAHFGAPCAIMRDLGRAMTQSAAGLVESADLSCPVLACHTHFLKDIGKDLLEPSHAQFRARFRQIRTRPLLRALARDLGRRLGDDIPSARLELAEWQRADGHLLPEGPAGLAAVRALVQWVLDYPAEGADQGFPFARPYHDLFERCVRAGRAADAFLARPPQDAGVLKVLRGLHGVLHAAASDAQLAQASRTLVRRAALFDELRSALRLQPKAPSETPSPKAVADLRDIHKAVDDLVVSLRGRRPERGPAQDQRQAIDLVLDHLETHGGYLWGHEVRLPESLGGGLRLVARTNNILEGFFHGMKHGERRRSGRKILTKDFEDLPAAAALARNLEHPDYVAVLCGTLDALPKEFADLDAEGRHQALQGFHSLAVPAPSSESASLSREDRRLVRTEAMACKVKSAASARAPRLMPPPASGLRVSSNRRLTP